MKLGTNTGADANGILRVWLTNLTDGGTVMAERTDVQWRNSFNPATGFFIRHWDPIWGGTSGGTLSQANQKIRVANMYVAGKGQIS
jgi:hypothetical protein